jgi:hypothetical protein
MKFEVLTLVTLKVTAIWVMTPYNLVAFYEVSVDPTTTIKISHLGQGTVNISYFCLAFLETLGSSEISVNIYQTARCYLQEDS